jgi:hypothetical protein
MKNNILTLVFILVAFSCVAQVSPKKDLKESPIVGNDADKHGCRASAGYTWSVLSNECIRIFERGKRLNRVVTENESANTLSAFVVFDEQGNKAELFLPKHKKTIILKRKSEGQPWVKNGWQLISWKGYVLKKRGKIIYTGQ